MSASPPGDTAEKLTWSEDSVTLAAHVTDGILWTNVSGVRCEDADRLFLCQYDIGNQRRPLTVTTTDKPCNFRGPESGVLIT